MARDPGNRSEFTPGSAPRNTEEGRAFLQSRLARFSLFMAFFNLGVIPVGVIFYNRQGHPLLGAVQQMVVEQLFIQGVLLGVWAATRRGRLSTPTLEAIDAISTTIYMAIVDYMTMHATPTWTRSDIALLYATLLFFALRASFVPSTFVRGLYVGALSCAPLVVGTYFYYARDPLPPPAPSPSALTVLNAVMCAPMIAVNAIVALTVHGLRERVRVAMQLGQYTLEEKIGEGGMGIVYRARHALLRRPTAIKLLPPERAGEHNVARFEREVQLTSMLTHANTIAIYDFGRTPEGVFYYVMEYLDGIDLEVLVSEDGPQTEARVAHLLDQVCASLAEAHAAGLIHRDIKPANVIVCERGGVRDVVKVLDFGLVRKIEGDAGVVSQTSFGTIVGTPLYLSPEAIVASDSIDARSDIYAVGALGYHLLAGRPPFEGSSVVDLCAQHLYATPAPPSQHAGRPIAADLEQLLLQCLAKKPEDRPASAEALRRALHACSCWGEWTGEHSTTWWGQHGKRLRSKRSTSRSPGMQTVTVARPAESA